jgi:hypothetical protein
MKLYTAIPETPFRRTGSGFSGEPVFHLQPVIGQFLIKVQCPKPVIEIITIGVIANTQYTFLYPEGISKISAKGISCNFSGPAIEILAVEKRSPGTSGHIPRIGNTTFLPVHGRFLPTFGYENKAKEKRVKICRHKKFV